MVYIYEKKSLLGAVRAVQTVQLVDHSTLNSLY